MGNAFDNFAQSLGFSFANILGAFALFFVGWLIAVFVSNFVQRALHRLGLNSWLSRRFIADSSQSEVRAEQWIGRGTFLILMLLVLVGFLQQLQLHQVSEPINQLLNQLFAFVPRLLSAAILLLVAWVIATALRHAIGGIARITNLQQTLQQQSGLAVTSLPNALADAAYWLVFLLFLPALLSTLKLEGLLWPIQNMIDKILNFLPNGFTALLLLLVGWLIARIAQGATSNVASALGVDHLSEKTGLPVVLGGKKISDMIGMLVRVLLFVPAIVAALDTLALQALARPVSHLLDRMLAAVPLLLAACLILVFAYMIGKVVAAFISSTLAHVGFDNVLAQLGLTQRAAPNNRQIPSKIVGHLVLIAIVVFAVADCAQLLGLTTFADLSMQLLLFAGRIVVGIVMLGAGLFLANVAATTILASAAVQPYVLAVAARCAILAITVAMALTQMGLGQEIVMLAFGLLLASIATACAIAFGLGGRDVAARQLETWLQSMASSKQSKKS
ncbi:MAG: mechanosensitive ion channel [Myxococcota bacterium]